MEFTFENKTGETTRVKTGEGFLDLDSYVYRSGLFEFSPSEFSPGEIPDGLRENQKIILNVSEETVRDPEFLNSLIARPVTEGHPSEFVNAKNTRYLQVGMTTGPGIFENSPGDKLIKSRLRIIDEEIIKSIEEGSRSEVSIGNTALVNWTPGVDKNGIKYDGELDKIRVNHVAIVNRGRGGDSVRLLNKKGLKMETIKKMINGVEVEIAESDATHFETLEAKIENAETEVGTLKAELENAKTESDAIKAELETLKSESDETAISKLVNERVATIETARKLFKEVSTEGTTREIMISAINSVNDKLIEEDASDEVITAIFNTLSKVERSESNDAGANVQSVINEGTPKLEDEVIKVRNERSERRRATFNKTNFGR